MMMIPVNLARVGAHAACSHPCIPTDITSAILEACKNGHVITLACYLPSTLLALFSAARVGMGLDVAGSGGSCVAIDTRLSRVAGGRG